MKIKIPDKLSEEFYTPYIQGYNACLKEWEEAEEANPIHKCKCCNEGVRTLRVIDDGLCQCPRCGGIVVFKDAQGQGELVHLDKAKIYEMLYRHKFAQGYIGFVNELYSTYGTPKAGVESNDIICPVCGYYCLGKGGHGCIDKPGFTTPERGK